jgi:TATA-binding protein-associated factor Taf7
VPKGKGPQDDDFEEEKIDSHSFEILSLDPARRLYGLKLNSRVWMATLVSLPSIIEAMKSLDNFNFYKSQDANQLLYIHPTCFNEKDTTKQERIKLI